MGDCEKKFSFHDLKQFNDFGRRLLCKTCEKTYYELNPDLHVGQVDKIIGVCMYEDYIKAFNQGPQALHDLKSKYADKSELYSASFVYFKIAKDDYGKTILVLTDSSKT